MARWSVVPSSRFGTYMFLFFSSSHILPHFLNSYQSTPTFLESPDVPSSFQVYWNNCNIFKTEGYAYNIREFKLRISWCCHSWFLKNMPYFAADMAGTSWFTRGCKRLTECFYNQRWCNFGEAFCVKLVLCCKTSTKGYKPRGFIPLWESSICFRKVYTIPSWAYFSSRFSWCQVCSEDTSPRDGTTLFWSHRCIVEVKAKKSMNKAPIVSCVGRKA